MEEGEGSLRGECGVVGGKMGGVGVMSFVLGMR